MENLQYDSFYKFLVSLGIILFALPVIIFFYILNMNYLLISQSDYENLSAISLQEIQTYEKILDIINTVVPIISIPIMVIGVGLVILGCRKWYIIQKELDEQVKSDTIIKKMGATQLNTSASTAKAYDEVVSEEETVTQVTTDKVIKYMEIEDKCYNYFLQKYSKRFYLKQNLRINNFSYDMIGISKNASTDYIFEIKYWTRKPSDGQMKQLYEQINKLGTNYKQTTEHNFEYVIIFVSTRSQLEQVRDKVKKFSANYKHGITEWINYRYLVDEDL